MKTIAVIQARLNSTRLPEKILLPLAGKSMLQNVVERVSRTQLIDCVVVACPLHDLDRIKKATFAELFSMTGDENDLIGRLLACAWDCEADYIVRICADNPCVKPEEIDHLIGHVQYLKTPCRELYLNSEWFKFNHDGFGGELYTFEMLEWMDSLIKNPLYREHPHLLWREMDAYSYIGSTYPPGFRLEVNTAQEYQKVKTIFEHFGHNHFTIKEAMEFLGTQDLEKLDFSA